MSRNRNLAMELLFDIIKLRFDLLDPLMLPADFNNSRWVQGQAIEIDWLTNCKIISHVEISKEIRFALVEYLTKSYFISIGLEDPDFLPSGLTYEPLNSGILTALVSDLELSIKPNITNLFLEQNIISQSDADPLYSGHQLSDLVKIFPNVYLCEISNQYPGDADNLNQLISNYLTHNTKFVYLPYKTATLNKINELILLNSKVLSYETVVQALVSSQFKFSFLDLYRCIEQLYQIIYTDETYTQLALTINRTDFLVAIENQLKWRPIERNSLTKIFNDTPEQYRKDLGLTIKVIDNQIKDYSSWLYDLRCNVVHLKSVQTRFDLTSENWEKLIFGLSNLLCYWYNKYPHFD